MLNSTYETTKKLQICWCFNYFLLEIISFFFEMQTNQLQFKLNNSINFILNMSVFQLQEWWGVKLSEEEEFDHGCMVLGNIDNAEPPSEKIAVGSLQGILRIYSPSHPQFKVEDLILEEVLNAPILQLLLGKFIPGSNLLGLAVLHPKRLVVYELIPQSKLICFMFQVFLTIFLISFHLISLFCLSLLILILLLLLYR